MAELDGLIDLIPVGEIADKLGIDEKTAKSAIKTALPALVAGLSSNASTDEGAAALEKALTKHATKSTKLSDVDEEDGKKIVSHVFGAKKGAVTEAVAGKADVTQELIAQILPIIAPIVLAWLAKKFLGGSGEPAKPAAKPSSSSSSGGVGDILGGLLGSKEGQDMLGSVLGGLLGGK